ncbi:MAG: S41 family peptidase [Gemmatimonadaceae bacterium]
MNRYRGLLLIGRVCAGLWGAGRFLQAAVRGRDTSARDGARLLDQVMERVRLSYVDEVEEDRLWHLAMRGLIGELGDPNSAYLPPERRARLEQAVTNSYPGVGLQVDLRDGWVTVLLVRPGSPAERAGLLDGDRLTAIDGRTTQGWTIAEARTALRGPAGTAVRLQVERSGAAPMTLALERAEIRVSTVARAMVLDGGLGYLALTAFSDSTDRELVRTIDSLRTAGARAMILDLRGNPGGLLLQGVRVADLFLDPSQRIVQITGRSASVNAVYVDSTGQRWPDLPMAVLVNPLTASAAEIVAGALQDHDRALVLGLPTYGKGSAQAIYELEDGAALSLTNARWVTPIGRSIEYAPTDEARRAEADTARPRYRTDAGRVILGGGGIVPDVTVGDTAALGAERRFLAALGTQGTAWRTVVRTVAAQLVREGAVRDSLVRGAPAWRERVLVAGRRAGLTIPPDLVAEATALIDRTIATEVVRTAFGAPYAVRWAVRGDPVVQRATVALRRARSIAGVFAAQ